jgi:lipoprotein NlpD
MRAGILIFLLTLLACGCSTSPGIYHTVAEGQTLYRISRAYGVDERYLARINRIDDPTRLRAGQRLFIPGVDRPRNIPDAPASKAVETPPPLPRKAAESGKVPPRQPAAPSNAGGAGTSAKKPLASPGDARRPAPAANASHGRKGIFNWPLAGELLRRFGDAGNPPCKGLEIAATRGTPVLSSAPGHVIYSGDGIRSYGNLLILRHDDDFFTVYGYNDVNLVKAGSFVSKGDRIALSGVPPDGGAPRLYFEIRRGKEPVNPIFFLP